MRFWSRKTTRWKWCHGLSCHASVCRVTSAIAIKLLLMPLRSIGLCPRQHISRFPVSVGFSGNPALGLACSGPPTWWGRMPSSPGTDRRLLRSGYQLVCDRRIVLYAGSLPDGVHRFRVRRTGDHSPFGPAVALEGGSQCRLVRNHDASIHVRLRYP